MELQDAEELKQSFNIYVCLSIRFHVGETVTEKFSLYFCTRKTRLFPK